MFLLLFFGLSFVEEKNILEENKIKVRGKNKVITLKHTFSRFFFFLFFSLLNYFYLSSHIIFSQVNKNLSINGFFDWKQLSMILKLWNWYNLVEINVKSLGVKGASKCVIRGLVLLPVVEWKVGSKNEKDNTCRFACETWLTLAPIP